MAKPLRFILEFSGWQNCRIDTDGDIVRPPTANEIAQAITQDLNYRLDKCTAGKLKVTLKKLN